MIIYNGTYPYLIDECGTCSSSPSNLRSYAVTKTEGCPPLPANRPKSRVPFYSVFYKDWNVIPTPKTISVKYSPRLKRLLTHEKNPLHRKGWVGNKFRARFRCRKQR